MMWWTRKAEPPRGDAIKDTRLAIHAQGARRHVWLRITEEGVDAFLYLRSGKFRFGPQNGCGCWATESEAIAALKEFAASDRELDI